MNLAGLILAAGASSRMGSPKALLKMPGANEGFLDRLISLLARRCSPVIVVLGHDAPAILGSLERAREAVIITNPRHEEGQLSSLQCGLGAVPPDAGGVMFTPVDYPAVRETTIDALADAFESGRAPVVIPRFGEQRGHPVCCARDVIDELLALPPGAQARDAIRRHRAQTHYVDVNDPGILRDVDTAEDYRELARSAEIR